MLGRRVLAFLPSQAVPALASLAGIYLYTRFASPADYGLFALVISVSQMCQSVLFYWIQVAATRNIEAARAAGSLPALEASVYRCHAYTFVLFAACYSVAVATLPLGPPLRHALWFGLAIVGLRSLVNVNQAFNLGALRSARYNLVECTQAIAALALGVGLMAATSARTGALLGALAAATFLVALPDLRRVAGALKRPAPRTEVTALLAFGMPLSISFALNYLLASADRLLVQYYLGAEQVGEYSAAYSLIDRAMSSLIVAVTLAAFPMAIRAFESDGPAGASRQLRSNGRLLVAVALPASALLAVLSPQLAGVMIGPAFRPAAVQIMPWIALAALMSGFQIHFFDHAFHLGRRTRLSLWTTGPAALLNIALNIVLLPRLGIMGAVWATLAGYALSLTASVVLGARVLAVPLDGREAFRVSLATAAMVAAVWLTAPSLTFSGLIAGAGVALLTYVVAALALDVLDSRKWLRRAWGHT